VAAKKKAAGGAGTDKLLVVVTCRDAEQAGNIARALVAGHLAACVNVLASPVGSIYHWKGRVEHTPEHLMLVKTSRASLPAVEKTVRRMHSYKVPEVIALPIVAGSAAYLKWFGDCIIGENPKAARRSK